PREVPLRPSGPLGVTVVSTNALIAYLISSPALKPGLSETRSCATATAEYIINVIRANPALVLILILLGRYHSIKKTRLNHFIYEWSRRVVLQTRPSCETC